MNNIMKSVWLYSMVTRQITQHNKSGKKKKKKKKENRITIYVLYDTIAIGNTVTNDNWQYDNPLTRSKVHHCRHLKA